MRRKLTVSVTVPTFNGQKTIVQCLDSLVSQERSPIEIIVVDDGSVDKTSSLVTEYSRSHPEVRLIKTPHLGASHARNEGLAFSKGGVVLFADSDAFYNEDYLTKAVEALSKDSKVGAVCVTGGIWIVKDTVVSRCTKIEYAIKQRLIAKRKLGPYFAYVYTKEALSKAGGYDESLFQGEDKDVFHRVTEAGFKVALVPGLNWYHIYPQDWTSLVKRCYRGGRTRLLYVVKQHRLGEYARSTGLFWVTVALTAGGFIDPAAWEILGLGFAAGYLYKVVQVFQRGVGTGAVGDLLALPMVSFVRYFATSVGYLKGTIIYIARRGLGKSTVWSDL